jgi:hypothetical protein
VPGLLRLRAQRSCSDGFLADRTTADQYTCAVQYRCKDGQLGSVLLAPKEDRGKDPLESRAWALQERLLSPRLIEFASHQIRWRCASVHGYDGDFPRDFLSGRYSQDHLLDL